MPSSLPTWTTQLVIFALSVYSWKTPTYDENVVYPPWAHSLGWFLMLLVTMQIPAVAVIMIILFAIRGKARAVVSAVRESVYLYVY